MSRGKGLAIGQVVQPLAQQWLTQMGSPIQLNPQPSTPPPTETTGIVAGGGTTLLPSTPPPMETIGPYDRSKDKKAIQLLRDLMISGSFLREILGPFQRGEDGKGREHFKLQQKKRETFGPQDKRKIA